MAALGRTLANSWRPTLPQSLVTAPPHARLGERKGQAAADGSGPRAGERVVAHVPAGGWAPRVAAPTDAVAPLPDHWREPPEALLALRERRVRGNAVLTVT
jgi:NADPH:quinone reductase-like Zn-dependent oxidoreductase